MYLEIAILGTFCYVILTLGWVTSYIRSSSLEALSLRRGFEFLSYRNVAKNDDSEVQLPFMATQLFVALLYKKITSNNVNNNLSREVKKLQIHSRLPEQPGDGLT